MGRSFQEIICHLVRLAFNRQISSFNGIVRRRRSQLFFDEFLDPRSLYAPLQKTALRSELGSLMARVDEADLEQQMDV